MAEVLADGKGTLEIILNDIQYDYKIDKKQKIKVQLNCIPLTNQVITLRCKKGSILIDTLSLDI